MDKEKPITKLCKHCKTEIPAGAKVCPNCRKKQGGILKWVGIVFLALIVLSAIGDKGGKEESKQASNDNAQSTSPISEEINVEKEEEGEPPVEYISVTATELSDALSNNAMKAQNDYKDKYLEITGKLGNIDSDGKYIGVNSNKDFDFTNIQCYIKSDEQKEVIMNMSKGDSIIVKGYCKNIGELLGYQIDIEEIMKQ